MPKLRFTKRLAFALAAIGCSAIRHPQAPTASTSLKILHILAVFLFAAWCSVADVTAEEQPKTDLRERFVANPLSRAAGLADNKSLWATLNTSLKKAEQRRIVDKSSFVDCTADFNAFSGQQIGIYKTLFSNLGVDPILLSFNNKHFVYFEITHKKLLELDYAGFRAGDRLILVFTTATDSFEEIVSFKASILSPL